MTEAARTTWSPAAVRALGVRTTVPIAGEILGGWGPSESYKAVKRGVFPVPVLQVGRKLIVPVAHILRVLGLDERGPDTPAARDG
jgi:hypothetical protein